jgi:predicted ATPase/DNA-binding winged helix-turn-helix (wHTH) protein
MSDVSVFEFGPFRLDAVRRELLASGIPVTIGQRAFDVLLALLRRPGDLVTKDELLAEVWPRLIVEENNLQVQVSALRKIFQAAADGERYLVTVAGRGYRFVAPVHAAASVAAARPGNTAPVQRAAVSAALPEALTTLIGREAEVEAVRARLAAHRLVTLTGAGGVGKTRLSIEVGKAVAPAFGDGVRFVELAPLSDGQLVFAAIAEMVADIGGAVATLDALVASLRQRELLLILDNCEHVLGETSRIVEALLRSCPRMSILASSREPLGLAGENVFPVPPLAAPAAMRLFEQRASALGIDFSLTDANAGLVDTICQSLDGLPLAIELAVPRLKVLSLAQVAHGLDDRFRLLTSGARTALPRHRTLEALIDWSYQPLSAAEKLFMQCFAVFAGSAALVSVQAVVADDHIKPDHVLDLLASLVEKSLIVSDRTAGEPRYRMLESVRLFARSKLADQHGAALCTRHARHFAARLAAASEAWETTAAADWRLAYAADVDNVRAALHWAFGPAGDVVAGLDLAGRSHVLWSELGLMFEHRHWLAEASRRCAPTTPADVVARLLAWQAGDVKDMDDPAEHEEALRAADIFRSLGDGFSEGRVLLRAGTALLDPEDVAAGERILRTARALLEARGRTKSLARCLGALATARLFAGDAATAHELHAGAVAIYGGIGELDGDYAGRRPAMA